MTNPPLCVCSIGSSGVFRARFIAGICTLGLLVGGAGCGSPSQANIELRKENQTLQAKVASLELEHTGDVASLAAQRNPGTTQPALPASEIEKMFTTHGLTLGRLTGGDRWDFSKPGDDGLKVYVVPIDEQNTPIKATGIFKIDAFDLDDPQKPLIGEWTFDLAQTRNSFYDQLMLYTYVLSCPWQTVPRHNDLTLKVWFKDELTGREYSTQKQVKINAPQQTISSKVP